MIPHANARDHRVPAAGPALEPVGLARRARIRPVIVAVGAGPDADAVVDAAADHPA